MLNDQNITGLRRPTRTYIALSRLKDFVCHVPHPITGVLSYDKLYAPYKEFVMNVSFVSESQFYHQEARIPERCKAMSEEITTLEANNTWTLHALPRGKKTIGCRWIYKTKFNVNGSLDKHKVWLVTKGYTQQPGLDFIDTFSPVAKLTFVRVVLSLAAAQNWKLTQLDINNAFLNGDLSE